MDIRIRPKALHGSVTAIPSKSIIHRAVVCALLSRAVTRIFPVIYSDDVRATLCAAAALGADVSEMRNEVVIDSTNAFQNGRTAISCGESGSTLRFMIPLVAATGITGDFSGKGRLPDRPLGELAAQLSGHDILFTANTLPFSINGRLTAGSYTLSGNVSSQYISGLLMALPSLPHDSRILLSSPPESKPYIDMTINVLQQFGVTISQDKSGYIIPGNQRYSSPAFYVESDWSNASCYIAAAACGADIAINGLPESTLQGDSAIATLVNSESVDVSNVPDIVPALCICAAFGKKAEFYNAARLRLKESDRINSVCAALNAMGIKTEQQRDSFIVYGGTPHGGTIDCCNDHRIAMAFSLLASLADSDSTLTGCECVAKSYPRFYDDFRSIGGDFDVLNR